MPRSARSFLEHGGDSLLIGIAVWLAVAYLILPLWWKQWASHHPALDAAPRITVTGARIPGDPLNLSVIGAEADLVAAMLAIGWHPAEKAEFGEAQVSAWETIQRSHAIANGVYVASVNRIGHEIITGNGIEFFGHSFICDPFGRILAMGSHDKEEILTATVDPALIEETRRNWPFLRDRRVDMYGGIATRWMTDNR